MNMTNIKIVRNPLAHCLRNQSLLKEMFKEQERCWNSLMEFMELNLHSNFTLIEEIKALMLKIVMWEFLKISYLTWNLDYPKKEEVLRNKIENSLISL